MRRMLLISGAVLGLATLGACSSQSGGSKGAADSAGGTTALRGAASAPHLSTVDDASAPKPAFGAEGTSAPLSLDAGKIRTAALTVAIKGAGNVATKANQAGVIATDAGGEVDSDDRTSGKHATASLRLLVPPDQLQPALSQLSQLGVEKTRSSSTRDVTTRVADVNSRVASAQEAITRLRQLYARAPKVRDIIAIESELSGREADLESLQAEQRALSRKTSMATISLQLITARKHVEHHKATHRSGFLGGLDRGWDAFRGAAGWVATALGAILPFLLLVLALGFAVRLAWPHLGRRPATAPPAAAPSE